MYKWHVQTVGRGRPTSRDIARVTDGIAASLRQFSDSTKWAAEDGGADKPPPSRTERSQEAFRRVSSLAKPTRGIDARSLAARPPGDFTITRSMIRPNDGPDRPWGERSAFPPRNQRPGFPPRDGARQPQRMNMRGDRGGFGGMGGLRGGRGGLGGMGAARGGRGGRGVRGGRGGRGGRGRGKTDRPKQDEDTMIEEPYNEEEKAYLKQSECGFETPYQPITSAESLQLLATPTVSSTQGVNSTLQYKLGVASGNNLGNYSHASKHLATMYQGTGLAFFEDSEQKSIAQDFAQQKKVEYNGMYSHRHGKYIESLDKETRTKLAKVWIAGQYEKPVMPTAEGDVLGQVGSFLRRNETYLPEDVRRLEAKLGTLLPLAQKPQSQRPTL